MAVARLVQPKQPPHSVEAEQSVLGGLMLNNRAWWDLADRLAEGDFYRADHQLIFRAIGEMIGANKACDFVTLSEHLRHQGKLDEAGGSQYLGSLAVDTYSVTNLLSYADIVRERSVLRGLVSAGMEISELGYAPGGAGAAELLDSAEQRLAEVSRRRGAAQIVGPGPILDSVAERIRQLQAGGSLGLSTGYADIDAKTQGLADGDLIIVAARPSMGKTSFAMNLVEYAAVEKGIPAAVFSMEMSKEQLMLRLLASFGRVDLQALRSGRLDQADQNRVASADNAIRQAPLYIDETGALSPLDLRARARRLVTKYGVRLIVVDYIQLMQTPGARENRTNEVSEISRQLKAMAKELGVPVVALSQLNRGVEQRDNKRPRLADLRESGGIEQDADIVLFIYRDEVYYEDSAAKGTAEIILGKQRNGPIGTARLAWLGRYCKFDDLAPKYVDL